MWFKVDDHLWLNPKTKRAGNAALGLWVKAGSWSGYELSDGYIPRDMLPSLGSPALARRLCDVGLWLPDGDGWLFHDWSDFNPTRAEAEARREANAKRLTRWRAEHRKED